MKRTYILLTVVLVLAVVAGGVFCFRQGEEAKKPLVQRNENNRVSIDVSTNPLEFFYYKIPEIGMAISLPIPLEGHISHVYREREDQSWVTPKEMTIEESYAGLEKCVSRGEKIKEVIFRYDEPFYFGDDKKGYAELGTLTEVKGMDSDNCGYGKIPGAYFVEGANGKLYKYTSIWSWMGSFTINQEKEEELVPLFFILDAQAGPSLRQIEHMVE